MRKYLFITLCASIGVLGGLLVVKQHKSEERERRLTMAEQAFASGCLTAGASFSATITNSKKRYEIQEMYIVECPKAGERFRNWIAGGNKK